jgi:DNA-binding response OmpR family regulator
MSGEKIVIIDDDPEICDAMSEILSEYDYQVSTALDTQTGYQLLLEQRPDLLILDIMMATMHEDLSSPLARPLRKAMAGPWKKTSTGFTQIFSWKNLSSQKS